MNKQRPTGGGESPVTRRTRFWATFLLALMVAGCSKPTIGPTIRVDSTGWSAMPATMVHTGEWFKINVVNATDSPLKFVIVEMNIGQVADLPLVDGVIDISRQVVYESDDPAVSSPLVVAYYVVYPEVLGEEAPGWAPAVVDPGEEETVAIGSPGLGGGERGSYAVISYEPGGLERGDFVSFDLTDEAGRVPSFDPSE